MEWALPQTMESAALPHTMESAALPHTMESAALPHTMELPHTIDSTALPQTIESARHCPRRWSSRCPRRSSPRGVTPDDRVDSVAPDDRVTPDDGVSGVAPDDGVARCPRRSSRHCPRQLSQRRCPRRSRSSTPPEVQRRFPTRSSPPSRGEARDPTRLLLCHPEELCGSKGVSRQSSDRRRFLGDLKTRTVSHKDLRPTRQRDRTKGIKLPGPANQQPLVGDGRTGKLQDGLRFVRRQLRRRIQQQRHRPARHPRRHARPRQLHVGIRTRTRVVPLREALRQIRPLRLSRHQPAARRHKVRLDQQVVPRRPLRAIRRYRVVRPLRSPVHVDRANRQRARRVPRRVDAAVDRAPSADAPWLPAAATTTIPAATARSTASHNGSSL